MSRISYVEKRFAPSSLEIIDTANEIIDEYAAQGFTLTLRQLYYQFVARDLMPNTQQSYKRVGSIVNDGRLAGLIDWESITNRTRNLAKNSHWRRPADIIQSAIDSYANNKWESQKFRPEVWIEKDALIGVIEGVCSGLDVPYFSCRGYVSQSEMWSAAQRFLVYKQNGQAPFLIHLGDHDPSGIDMTRDISARLGMFTYYDGGEPLPLLRVALNMDQIKKYNPPPNPTKITDSRANSYIKEYGSDSWELDALEPSVIADLIKHAVLKIRDEKKWKAAVLKEEAGRDQLIAAQDRLA